MNKKLVPAFLLAISAGALSACSPSGTGDKTTSHISVGATLDSNLPPKEKAEALAKQAEELLSADGFLQASQTADLALQQDSQNVRAGLIKALLTPVLKMKGLQIRVRPLMRFNPKDLAEYDKNLETLRKEANSALKSYLLDGKEDIQSESDLQGYMEELLQAFDDLRLYVKKIKTSELTIKANLALVPDLNARYTSSCEIKETASLEYELVCPPSEDRYNITLNQADFSNLQDMAAAYEIYLAIGTSYDSTGALDVMKSLASKQSPTTADEISQELFKNPNFGKLRSQNKLARIPELGLDYVAGLRWALAHQDTLCPKGQTDAKNRPGMFLNQGICLSTSMIPYLQDNIEKPLSGELIDVKADSISGSYSTKIRPLNLFEKPVSDLHILAPLRFDACQGLISVGDNSMNGVFPNNDLNKVLSARDTSCAH